MPLEIDGLKLIPTPFVNISKQINFTPDGQPLSTTHRITLQGSLLPNKGSPTSNGWHVGEGEPADQNFTSDADRHNSILAKQEFLRDSLVEPGVTVRYSPPGYDVVEFNPRVVSIDFDPGQWVIKSDYTIELETDSINREGTPNSECLIATASGLNLSDASDSFSVLERTTLTPTYEVVRTVSATALTRWSLDVSGEPEIFGEAAFLNAKTWVRDRLDNNPLSSGQISNFVPSGIDHVSGLIPFNNIEEESIDRLAGTYSVVQRVIFASTGVSESRTSSTTFITNPKEDGGPSIVNTTVNGVISGLAEDNILGFKILNARNYFNEVRGSLSSFYTANNNPSGQISFTTQEDPTQGILNYTLNYVWNSGSAFSHNYNVNYNGPEQGNPTVNIQGTIQGFKEDGEASGRFGEAVTGWESFSTSDIKNLAFSQSSLFGGAGYSNNFANEPISKNVVFNPAEGTVGYNYVFGWADSPTSDHIDDYIINLNTLNAESGGNAGYLTTASINGTIRGLIDNGSEDPTVRITNAKSAWDTISGQLFTRVNNEYSRIGGGRPSLNPNPLTRSIRIDESNGVITYTASFNNSLTPDDSSVAIEEVTVSDNAANTDIFAVQVIPGRSNGPIIQDIATTDAKRRDIAVAITMRSQGSNRYDYSDIDTVRGIGAGITSGYLPAGDRNEDWWIQSSRDQWNPSAGFYTVNTTVIY